MIVLDLKFFSIPCNYQNKIILSICKNELNKKNCNIIMYLKFLKSMNYKFVKFKNYLLKNKKNINSKK